MPAHRKARKTRKAMKSLPAPKMAPETSSKVMGGVPPLMPAVQAAREAARRS